MDASWTTTYLVLVLQFVFRVCYTNNTTTLKVCPHRRLTQSDILEEMDVISQLMCSRACIDSNKCQSANFIHRNHGYTCQLLAETVKCEETRKESDSDFLTYLVPRCVHGGTWNVGLSRCVDCDHGFTGIYCGRHIIDCAEGALLGYTNNEFVLVQPINAAEPFEVYCYYLWKGLEVERRGSKYKCREYEKFDRNWNEYKYGFGSTTCEYFIGLENIRLLASQRLVSLNVHLDSNLNSKYLDFTLDNESSNYTIHYSAFSLLRQTPSGDGFGLGAPNASVNHMPFCTVDRDCGSCARISQSGWWFNTACAATNLHAPLNANVSLTWPLSVNSTTLVSVDKKVRLFSKPM